MPLFGSHLSIAGGMYKALDEADRLGLDAVQVFTKNQQQWRIPPLSDETVDAWTGAIKSMGWDDGKPRTVSHASYLINLASPDDALWKKSIDLMIVEIERCERLGIAHLVHHPGAFTSSTEPEGIDRIVKAYGSLLKRTKGFRTVLCLENTVGSGSNLGRTFEQLDTLRTRIATLPHSQGRVGFCFDTCHAHAAGYDLSDPRLAAAVIDLFDQTCGLEHLKVVHLNDSKGEVGSRRDRHEHIGKGTIGLAGFGAFVGDARLADRPMILETPKGTTEKGTPFDTLNLRRLTKLMKAAGTNKSTGPAGRRKARPTSVAKG